MFKQQSILLLQSKGGHGTHLQKRTNTLPTHCVSSLRYRSRTVSLIITSSISHQRPVSTSTVQRRLCNSAFKVQHPKGKSHLPDWPIVCLLWSKRPAEIETCIFFFMVCLASHCTEMCHTECPFCLLVRCVCSGVQEQKKLKLLANRVELTYLSFLILLFNLNI